MLASASMHAHISPQQGQLMDNSHDLALGVTGGIGASVSVGQTAKR